MIEIVRHGSTQSNERGLLQGARIDPNVSAKGFEEADATAAALIARRAEGGASPIIVSSPLKRARQTAAIIAKAFEGELSTDPAFTELDYGTWDGQPIADVPAETWRQWRADPHFTPPEGESLAALAERVHAGFAHWVLEATRANCDLIIVSHVSPIKAIVAHILGAPIESSWNMYLDTASITTARARAGMGTEPNQLGVTLLRYNDTNHLHGLRS